MLRCTFFATFVLSQYREPAVSSGNRKGTLLSDRVLFETLQDSIAMRIRSVIPLMPTEVSEIALEMLCYVSTIVAVVVSYVTTLRF